MASPSKRWSASALTRLPSHKLRSRGITVASKTLKLDLGALLTELNGQGRILRRTTRSKASPPLTAARRLVDRQRQRLRPGRHRLGDTAVQTRSQRHWPTGARTLASSVVCRHHQTAAADPAADGPSRSLRSLRVSDRKLPPSRGVSRAAHGTTPVSTALGQQSERGVVTQPHDLPRTVGELRASGHRERGVKAGNPGELAGRAGRGPRRVARHPRLRGHRDPAAGARPDRRARRACCSANAGRARRGCCAR